MLPWTTIAPLAIPKRVPGGLSIGTILATARPRFVIVTGVRERTTCSSTREDFVSSSLAVTTLLANSVNLFPNSMGLCGSVLLRPSPGRPHVCGPETCMRARLGHASLPRAHGRTRTAKPPLHALVGSLASRGKSDLRSVTGTEFLAGRVVSYEVGEFGGRSATALDASDRGAVETVPEPGSLSEVLVLRAG